VLNTIKPTKPNWNLIYQYFVYVVINWHPILRNHIRDVIVSNKVGICPLGIKHQSINQPNISPVTDLDKADIANNPYLMVRSRSEYYTSMSVSGLPTFLISVKNINLLSSSIYKHLKTYLIKHKQSLMALNSVLLKCQRETWNVFIYSVRTTRSYL
jgi:hypothetical protein